MSDSEKVVPLHSVTPEGIPEERAPKHARSALQSRTAEDIANEQTIERLALRVWTAMVVDKVLGGMSALLDELIQSHLLDDDDEEADEGWFDDHAKREKKMLDEAITEALVEYPDINAINNLPPSPDQNIAWDADQLRDVLAKCAIGATEFRRKFPRAHLENRVKSDLKKRFEREPKYREHVRGEVPGSNIKTYGGRGCTSSKGTFVKVDDFESGGSLEALLTGGWMRVAKDRIDPVAWSYQHGLQRKTERQSWKHHFDITERDGSKSPHELPREKLAGAGASAIRSLIKAGIHVIRRDVAQKALVQFLGFRPKHEIIRMRRVGWAQVGSHWLFVRPDEVITPPGMPQARNATYALDAAETQHGLHVAGTAAEWAAEIAAPLKNNSNVGLSFGTFFASPLLCFASEPGGGKHLYGRSTIGKTMVSALGQSIYGWPHETADDAFGTSWEGSVAGFDALALARTDLGLPMDEITLCDRRTAEAKVYKIASGTKGPRAKSTGQLRETAHASVLVLSTGEKSLVQFIGKDLQEGARKRLVDVPAEVQPGSAFESIPPAQLHDEGKRLFDLMKRQHGAVGYAWQRHLVNLGPLEIKAQLDEHREAFLSLPEVDAVAKKPYPSVRAVVNRFALYAAALRMAITARLLPWSVEEADRGVVMCMARWQRDNVDTAGELQRAADAVVVNIKAALSDRFITIHKPKRVWEPATEVDAIKQKSAGSFDGFAKPDRILVRPEAWPRYCNGLNPHEIAKHLQEQGTLIPGRDGKLSKAEQVIGKVDRFYVLSLTPLTP